MRAPDLADDTARNAAAAIGLAVSQSPALKSGLIITLVVRWRRLFYEQPDPWSTLHVGAGADGMPDILAWLNAKLVLRRCAPSGSRVVQALEASWCTTKAEL